MISAPQVLNAVPEQDAFYDVADTLEEQGMDRITQRHMDRQGADLDLLTQFQIYEVKSWSTNVLNWGVDDTRGTIDRWCCCLQFSEVRWAR